MFVVQCFADGQESVDDADWLATLLFKRPLQQLQ